MPDVKKIAKNTTSRVSRTSSLIALDPEILGNIDKGLETQGIVIVRAPSMGGKTTIVREWHRSAVARGEMVASIEFRAEAPISTLTEKLSVTLGFENSEIGFGEIIEEAAHQKITLIIDGFDRVNNGAPFLREALEALRADVGVRLLITAEQIPTIDALDLVDLRIIDYKGLNEKTIVQLIKVSGAQLDQPIDEIAKTIYQLTNGNPSLVRLTISNAIQSGGPLLTETLQAAHSDIVGHFTRSLFDKTTSTYRLLLEELALVKFSADVRDQIISELQPSLILMLEQAALLRKSLEGSWAIEDKFGNSLAEMSTKPETDSARSRIVDRAKNTAHIEGRVEEVWQLNLLERLDESVAIINENFDEIVGAFSPQVRLDLTEPIWRIMSPESYRIRQASLFSLALLHKSSDECEYRVQHSSSARESLAFKIFDLRVSLSRGHYPATIDEIENALKTISATDYLYFDGRNIISRYLRFSNPVRSLEIRKENFEAVERAHDVIGLRQIIYSSLSFFYETDCRMSDAISVLDLLHEKARIDKNYADIGTASQGRIALKYDVGRITESIRELPICKDLLERRGIVGPLKFLYETESVYAFDCGLISKSFDIIRRTSELYRSGIVYESWIPNIGATLAMAAAALGRGELIEGLNQDYDIALDKVGISPVDYIRRPLKIIHSAFKMSATELSIFFDSLRGRLQTGYRYYSLRSILSAFEIMWQRGFLISVPWLETEFLQGLDAATIVWKVRYFILAEEVFRAPNAELIPKIRVMRNFFSQFDLSLWMFRCDLLLALCGDADNGAMDFGQYMKFESIQDRELQMILGDHDSSIGRRDLLSSMISKSVVDLISAQRRKAVSVRELAKRSDSTYVLDLENRELKTPSGMTPLRQRATAFNLIRVLAEHPHAYLDKETLTTLVWNETYNPLVHDTRIYTSINRIRELVPIESVEGTYRISVKIVALESISD